MSAIKKIRLEQKAMPVSSEEELTLITLREQNHKLSNNHNHRIRIEADLRKKIEQLQETLRLCEDKEPDNQLTLVNEFQRNQIADLELELNKSRLNERRLADDLDRLKEEFNDLKKRILQSNSDSIRNANSSTIHHQHMTPSDQTNQPRPYDSTGTSTGDVPMLSNVPFADENLIANQTKKIQQLETKLEDTNTLAEDRLKELQSLNDQYKQSLLTIDRLKAESRSIPKEVIIETAEYKTLQSHFSVLYNEATQLKTQLTESRALIVEMKESHSRQIDRMSNEDQRIQKDMRNMITTLERDLAKTTTSLTALRDNYEKALLVNEQTVKLDTELKKSVGIYKTQVQQKNNELNRLKRLLEEFKRLSERQQNNDTKNAIHNSDQPNHIPDNQNKTTTHNNSSSSTNNNGSNNSSINLTNNHSPSNKKIIELKEIISQLQKQLEKTKSEEEALMQDAEITGQAYEDMQEQNHSLLQQLEEKDEAYFKLMSENLKSNAFQKHLTDEKTELQKRLELCNDLVNSASRETKSQNEKVQLLQENLATLEKELELRNTLNDTYKQERLDLRQQLSEIKSEKEKILGQLEQYQRTSQERTATLHDESYKHKRTLEEYESLKKQLDRVNKMQSASAPDEVLVEEIREYKEQLTCPSCKTKPKDAVLTKCFHVFCYDCLKTRVDTRQRKCPKCNAQFGANDFHRLYLV